MNNEEYRFITKYNEFITSQVKEKNINDLTPEEREIYLDILKSEFIPKVKSKSYFDWKLQFRNSLNSLGIEQKEFNRIMKRYRGED